MIKVLLLLLDVSDLLHIVLVLGDELFVFHSHLIQRILQLRHLQHVVDDHLLLLSQLLPLIIHLILYGESIQMHIILVLPIEFHSIIRV